MLKVMEYRQKIKALKDEANAFFAKAGSEKRTLTDEETKKVEGIDSQIAVVERDMDNYIKVNRIPEESLRSYEAHRPETPDTTPAAKRDGFGSLGEFLLDVRSFAMTGGAKFRNTKLLGRMVDGEQRAALGAQEAVPSDGGFLLYPEHTNEILEKMHAQGEVYNRCSKRTIGPNANTLLVDMIDESSRADGSRWGAVRGYWEAEADSVTGTSKLKLAQEEIKLNKIMAVAYATDEALQDAVQLESKIVTTVPKELMFKLEDAVIRGDGAGKPQGILSSNALVTQAKESGQTADTVVTENILKMWKQGWGRANSVWFYNQELEDQLDTLTFAVGTGGELARLFIPNADGTPGGRIKGRPAIPIEQASGPGDVGDIILADMSQYIIGEKGGVQGATSIHVQFLTGQSTFRFIWRVAGASSWKDKLTPYKRTSATYYQSPFVALAAR